MHIHLKNLILPNFCKLDILVKELFLYTKIIDVFTNLFLRVLLYEAEVKQTSIAV